MARKNTSGDSDRYRKWWLGFEVKATAPNMVGAVHAPPADQNPDAKPTQSNLENPDASIEFNRRIELLDRIIGTMQSDRPEISCSCGYPDSAIDSLVALEIRSNGGIVLVATFPPLT